MQTYKLSGSGVCYECGEFVTERLVISVGRDDAGMGHSNINLCSKCIEQLKDLVNDQL